MKEDALGQAFAEAHLYNSAAHESVNLYIYIHIPRVHKESQKTFHYSLVDLVDTCSKAEKERSKVLSFRWSMVERKTDPQMLLKCSDQTSCANEDLNAPCTLVLESDEPENCSLAWQVLTSTGCILQAAHYH